MTSDAAFLRVARRAAGGVGLDQTSVLAVQKRSRFVIGRDRQCLDA
jgi:hypothetical protein